MFKKIVLVMLVLISVMSAKDIVVITDTSQGITKDEAINLDNIIIVGSKIYESNDWFLGSVFTDKKKAYEKFNGQYISKGDSKKGWRKFRDHVYNPYMDLIISSISSNENSMQVTEKDIVLLIDTSGSMKLKNSSDRIIKKLNNTLSMKGEKVNFAIVTFDGHKTFDKSDNSRIVLGFTTDKSKISSAINSINFTNLNTMMADGLSLSVDLLKDRKTKSKMILLISDGDISDEASALQKKQEIEKYNIIIKPYLTGGDNLTTLEKISSDGNVYKLSSADFENSIQPPKPQHMNDLFYNFADLTDNIFKKTNTKDGMIIIYSTMINHSDFYEFNTIPNLSDDSFYDELIKNLKKGQLNIDFNGLKVYIRAIGNPSRQKAQELKIFWKRFMKDHNAGEIVFTTADLILKDIGY